MRKLFIVCLIVCCGCATTGIPRRTARFKSSGFVSVEQFCAGHKLQYSFDTIDDMIRLFSSDKELRLLLHSPVVYFNGSIFTMGSSPVYRKGSIVLPRELARIISVKRPLMMKSAFSIKTIVIDPGHGGKDPGAVSPTRYYEKTVNLNVAKYLKTELQRKGFKVILTRSRDVFLTLHQRCDVARRHKADLFISIHANANRSKYVSGVEVYYLAPAKLDSAKRSLTLARKLGFQARQMPFSAKAILWDLLITKNHSLSVELVYSFYTTFKNLGFKVKPPRKAPYYVLKNAYVPSVLVEMGYLSNRYEEKILRKKYYQQQIAEAIAKGIMSFNKQHVRVAQR